MAQLSTKSQDFVYNMLIWSWTTLRKLKYLWRLILEVNQSRQEIGQFGKIHMISDSGEQQVFYER